MNKLKLFSITGIISLIIGCLFAEPLTYFLITLLPKGIKFVAINPFDGFMILMWVGFAISIAVFGFIFSVWAWWNYKDILYKKEKELIIKSLFPSSILFLFGLCFGMFLYLNIMLPFFLETNVGLGLENLWSMYNVIVTGLGLSIMLGFCFELPLVVRGLIEVGLVTKQRLKENRGIVLFVVCLVSAVITPTPDLLSMFLVALPLYGLFEVSLL